MRGGDAQHPFLLPNFLPAFGARGCLRAAGQSPGSVGGVSPSSPAVPLGCSPCSCVAPQALPGVRVNKLISTKPWLWCGSVGLGTGSAAPSCCPLGLDQVQGSRVCAPGAPHPAPCTQQAPQNNFWGLHKEAPSILGAAPLPLPSSHLRGQRAVQGAPAPRHRQPRRSRREMDVLIRPFLVPRWALCSLTRFSQGEMIKQ